MALALLLASAVAGTAQADVTIPADARRTQKCSTGLVKAEQGTSTFHVTLDEYGPESGVYVAMRFIDAVGNTLQSQVVALRRGVSASLNFTGAGFVRVQADVFQLNPNLRSESAVLASLSLNGTDIGRFIGPPIWYQFLIACPGIPSVG
jgi:hypothetical protein